MDATGFCTAETEFVGRVAATAAAGLAAGFVAVLPAVAGLRMSVGKCVFCEDSR